MSNRWVPQQVAQALPINMPRVMYRREITAPEIAINMAEEETDPARVTLARCSKQAKSFLAFPGRRRSIPWMTV